MLTVLLRPSRGIKVGHDVSQIGRLFCPGMHTGYPRHAAVRYWEHPPERAAFNNRTDVGAFLLAEVIGEAVHIC